MTDVFSLTTSGAWRKLNRLCIDASQVKEMPVNNTQLHAINYLSIAPYSTEDGTHYLAEVANEDALAACNLALYRASLLFAYKHVANKDYQLAHEECCHAISNLEAGLNRLGITPELERHDLTKNARGFVNSLASQAELQQARIKGKIASHLVFILGMHRSGTSALTGMLAHAGFSAPSDLMPASVANPKGYWESLGIMSLNEDFLAELESHWSSSLPLPAGWTESISARKWRTSLINLISEAFGGAELATIKDPRFCTLVMGLEPWLESRLIDISFFIPVRHPLEVSDSLLQANGTSLNKALHLWIKSIFTTEQATRGHQRKFINFEALIQDPANALETCLGLVESAADSENEGSIRDYQKTARHQIVNQAATFIDKSLRRQHAAITKKNLTAINKSSNSRLIYLAETTFQAIIDNITDDNSISRALDKLWPSILEGSA